MRIASLSLPALSLIACGTPEEPPPPPTPVLTLGPEAPCTTEDLVATLENGTATVWRWTVGGQPAEVDGPTVSSELTAKGQRWRVAVEVEETGTVVAAEVNVINCGPTVRSLALSPEAPTGMDTLTATLQADDPDGDTLSYTYRWLVNDEEVRVDRSGRTTSDFSLAGLGRGAQVTVEVGSSDGLIESDTLTESIEVVNTPPTAPVITIEPELAIIDMDLTCLVVEPATDVDGDEITYNFSWSVNGTAFTDATTTTLPGDTVPFTATNDQDVWTCSVTASDGVASSEASIDDVLVIAWTGPREFTTCGAEGRNGPTQEACDAAYADANLAGEVTVDAGFQLWTVPSTGRYVIRAAGAQAGGGGGTAGGTGAIVEGEFDLEKGETLRIAVGQAGSNGSREGGGGGASWVVKDGTPLLVGGGGGAHSQYSASWGYTPCNASITEYGTFGGWGCGGVKSSGLGEGGSSQGCESGGGGGGLNSSGGNDTCYGYGGGASYAAGLQGGQGGSTGHGGFGGGGGGGGWGGAGGGGGYSGGDGGRSSDQVGGGGGSYNDGASPSAETGHRGDGEVFIDLL